MIRGSPPFAAVWQKPGTSRFPWNSRDLRPPPSAGIGPQPVEIGFTRQRSRVRVLLRPQDVVDATTFHRAAPVRCPRSKEHERAMYEIGWARSEIEVLPRGYAMNGYGMAHHRATRPGTSLHARALVIRDDSGGSVVICCLDMAMVTHAMRHAARQRLAEVIGEGFRDESFVLCCTHSHSTPGGCGYEALYNFVTPGFVPDHLDAVTDAVVDAVTRAWSSAAEAELTLGRSTFAPTQGVAWNRSVPSYNRNPEVDARKPSEAHLAIDREMAVLSVRREGEAEAFLSLFGVHATCIGNTHDSHDGDNKGRAAAEAESRLRSAGRAAPVAIFAQGTAGDVSPHYHGPGQWFRRRRVRRIGDHGYAQRNGELQAARALSAVGDPEQAPISGDLDAVLTYRDLSDMAVPARFVGGSQGAHTSDPCHGVAFFEGTPVDGRGAPRTVGWLARGASRVIRWRRLARTGASGTDRYYARLHESQGPKDILLEDARKLILGRPLGRVPLPDFVDVTVAEMKREARAGAVERSPLVPSVLPVQIVRIGALAIACCPGEFTTVAGARLRETVAEVLAPTGVTDVLMLTYCNDYMGYVTTAQEYQEQRYEGGHTIFGQWTLGAFQSIAAELAERLTIDRDHRPPDDGLRPPPPIASELAARSNVAPRG